MIHEATRGLTPEKVKAVLAASAELEARDGNSATPLMWAAAENENPEVVQALLDDGAGAGAGANIRDDYDATLLMRAARNNENPEVVRALLDADATAISDDGETACELVRENEALKGTNVYQRINELRLE